MRAKSIKGKSPKEIQSELEQCMADGFKPTLAITFISIKQDRKAVCDLLHAEGIDIVGATTCGVFSNGYQDGYEGDGSIVLLLLELDRSRYSVLFEDIGERNLDEVAGKLANEALEKFKKPAFILCSTGVSSKGDVFAGDKLIRSLQKVMGPDVHLYGGMAGDDWTFSGSFVFNYEQSSDTGLVALVLDEEKISFCGSAISGWQPMGTVRTVTKCEDDLIHTIDDKPALEMYLRYLGNEPVSGDNLYEMFEDVGIHYPFQVEGADDPIMRTPMMIDKEKGALKMDFAVPEGTKLRFSMPPDFDIVENILGDAQNLKDKTNSDAEALLIFSCVGRLSALGPLTSKENEGLSEVWKAPMAGFFTYGEYGTVSNERLRFHSTTCCWVTLKEK